MFKNLFFPVHENYAKAVFGSNLQFTKVLSRIILTNHDRQPEKMTDFSRKAAEKQSRKGIYTFIPRLCGIASQLLCVKSFKYEFFSLVLRPYTSSFLYDDQ